MKDIKEYIGEEEHEQRMRAARARATWELGSPGWAGVIINAYLHPEEDKRALEAEAAA